MPLAKLRSLPIALVLVPTFVLEETFAATKLVLLHSKMVTDLHALKMLSVPLTSTVPERLALPSALGQRLTATTNLTALTERLASATPLLVSNFATQTLLPRKEVLTAPMTCRSSTLA